MSICNTTGLACCCQPDEGVECPFDKPGALRQMMLEWRAAAIAAQAERDALLSMLKDCADVEIMRTSDYLCDAIDNDGKPHQSSGLAAALSRAERSN